MPYRLARLLIATRDGGSAAANFAETSTTDDQNCLVPELDQLTDALRRDDIDADAYFALPLLADELADHPDAAEYLPIVDGLRRRGRIMTELTASLVRATSDGLNQRGIPHVLIGDFGTAAVVSQGRPDRAVTDARIVVPRRTARSALAQVVSEASATVGASELAAPRRGLALHGVHLRISRSAGPVFGFPTAREYLWRDATGPASADCKAGTTGGKALLPSPEFAVFDSIARSSLGPPRVRWLMDVLAANRVGIVLDWQRVLQIGEAQRWSAPVVWALRDLQTLGVMSGRGPMPQPADSYRDGRIDHMLQRLSASGPSGRTPRWVLTVALTTARNVRYWPAL
jgi:hypothetical protein